MQCFTELTAPTAVTHSLSLPFLSPAANNLIVTKTNLLQIFALKSVVTNRSDPPTHGPSASAGTSKDRGSTTKLALIAQYELSGTVTSLGRVKILKSKSGGEALLVALRDAKLSLVEWDPERYSIFTISLHYYEREDILASPWESDLSDCSNYLTVDPSSRCAALKFGARHLAILPFHQIGDDLIMDDFDAEFDDEKPALDTSVAKDVDGQKSVTPYAASFVLSLLALDPALTHPIHLSFLYEYREPTFGILYSQSATSSALLHERRDNVSFAVYTLDLEQKASTTLSSVSDLPYDLHTIIPLSRAIGGVLLVGINEIVHVDQSGKTNGIAVNDLAKKSTSFTMGDQSDLGLRLEGCIIKQLGWDNVDLLIVLNNGELAIISFNIDGRSVSGLSIRSVKEENGGLAVLAGPSCAAYIGRGRMFIGSESADSVVLGWSRASDRLKRQRSRMDIDVDDANAIADFDEENIVDDDEDDLYTIDKPDQKVGDDKTSASITDPEDDYIFRVHDSLLNVGPMTDIALTTSSGLAKRSTKSPSELMTTTGYGRAGGLTAFRFEIHPKNVDCYDISGASSIWAIRPKTNAQDDTSGEFDRYIVATTTTDEGENRSRAYAIKTTGLEEVQDTDFDPEVGGTIEVGTLNGGLHVVQVLETELRTFDGGESAFSIICMSFLPSSARFFQRVSSLTFFFDCARCTSIRRKDWVKLAAVMHYGQKKKNHCFYNVNPSKEVASQTRAYHIGLIQNLYPPYSTVPCASLDVFNRPCLILLCANIKKDFSLSQIFPLNDEESENGPQVISACFADPYLLLVRNDKSIRLLKADESGDLDEVEQQQSVKEGKWTSGCMYEDMNDALRLEYPEDENDEVGNVLLFLLSVAGGLHVSFSPPFRHLYTLGGVLAPNPKTTLTKD